VLGGPEFGVPVLAEAYVALECRVVDSTVWGDHTWFVGEVRSLLASNSLREDATVNLDRGPLASCVGPAGGSMRRAPRSRPASLLYLRIKVFIVILYF